MGIAHVTMTTPGVHATCRFFGAVLGGQPIDRPPKESRQSSVEGRQ